MTTQEIATAMRRVESILRRRPDVGMHAEAPASPISNAVSGAVPVALSIDVDSE